MDQRDVWNDLVGEPWIRHADVIDAQNAPFGAAAMEALGPIDGATVVDVGCGTGTTTYELAARGAKEVVGVDLSDTMVAYARDRRGGEASGSVRFLVADAAAFTSEQRFDALYSRFGVMFFGDATAAFGHLREMMIDGGRLAFAAWSDPAINPWMLVPVMASVPVLGPPALPHRARRARSRSRRLSGCVTCWAAPAGETSPSRSCRSSGPTPPAVPTPWPP